jgi:hypothetical protein
MDSDFTNSFHDPLAYVITNSVKTELNVVMKLSFDNGNARSKSCEICA